MDAESAVSLWALAEEFSARITGPDSKGSLEQLESPSLTAVDEGNIEQVFVAPDRS